MPQAIVWRGLILVAMLAGEGPLSGVDALPRQSTSLTLEIPVERHLDRGQIDRYTVALSAGERVSIDVEQQGLDVVVDVLDADGTPIVEIQEEVSSHGTEHLQLVAEAPGPVIVAVSPARNANIEAGSRYAIRLGPRQAATDADRTIWNARNLQTADLVARETMTAYYRGLHHGLGRGEALRQAKLTLLRRKGRQHPFFWASFIQSGQWGVLD
jgi:hypothetical protein